MPEGESLLDIQARFVPFIQQLVTDTHPNEAVVLVGHGGLYHAMLPRILQNIDYEVVTRHPFANTAYAVAETRLDGLYCREWRGMVIED